MITAQRNFEQGLGKSLFTETRFYFGQEDLTLTVVKRLVQWANQRPVRRLIDRIRKQTDTVQVYKVNGKLIKVPGRARTRT